MQDHLPSLQSSVEGGHELGQMLHLLHHSCLGLGQMTTYHLKQFNMWGHWSAAGVSVVLCAQLETRPVIETRLVLETGLAIETGPASETRLVLETRLAL